MINPRHYHAVAKQASGHQARRESVWKAEHIHDTGPFFCVLWRYQFKVIGSGN
jgi:hypothetical protein